MFILFENNGLTVMPIEFKYACNFVNTNHRHCKAPIGHIFSLACYYNGLLCGVAICGRPVSRYLDNGSTIEINRLCTDGTRNACSKLYSACVKYAKKKKFKKVITYTLINESGSSLKAANFKLESEQCGGLNWHGTRQRKHEDISLKKRWVFEINNDK